MFTVLFSCCKCDREIPDYAVNKSIVSPGFTQEQMYHHNNFENYEMGRGDIAQVQRMNSVREEV